MPQRYRPRARVPRGACCGAGFHNINALPARCPALKMVVCGRRLLADKYFPIINQDNRPVDSLAADLIVSQKRIGGLEAVRVPYFPANSLLVTRLNNLSLYFQEGARRRTIKDNPEFDRIDNFESSNDAYVIEDLGCAAMAENITVAVQ